MIGDTSALLDALIGALRRRRVGLQTAVTVDAITVGPQGVTGLTVGGEHRPFDTVVSTAPKGIVHIDAIPKTGLYGGVNHILGLGMNSYLLQNVM